MREVCQCAVTERMCACRQREDICRRRSGNAQTTEVGALFKRAVSVLSALCQCPLMATETLRGEGMCANSGGVYAETTFRECVHEHATTCTRLTWRNVSWLQARPLDRLQRCV